MAKNQGSDDYSRNVRRKADNQLNQVVQKCENRLLQKTAGFKQRSRNQHTG